MKIILLQDIRGVGKRNDIKEVRDGYAVNFLIAKKLGVQATPHEIARRDAIIQKEQQAIQRLKKQAAALEKESLSYALKTGAHGEIFNSITTDDIKKTLEEKGYEGIKEIALEKPIRNAGIHQAVVYFKQGIKTPITIITICG